MTVKLIYYRPQRSWGKVMFSQACVILFTGGGVCLSACWDTTPQGADTPPGADPPEPTTPPQSRHPPEQTPPRSRPPTRGVDPPRSRHPLAEHAGRYGQRAGGTHPTGMQSCYYVRISVRWCRENHLLRKKNLGCIYLWCLKFCCVWF